MKIKIPASMLPPLEIPQHVIDKTNRQWDIYTRWCAYQERHGMPAPKYPPQAYKEEVLEMWDRIMSKE